MSRSKSSKQWLKEHFDDRFVQQSKEQGYRSRASYKLLFLNEKDKIFKPGMTVVDLGSAPGGWSQIAKKLVGSKGLVIASDILPMDPIPGVEFIQGDFTEDECYQQILAILGNRPVDLVISDMAPNMSGMSDIDQPRSMALVDLAVEFANQTLSPGGCLVMKVFQGQGFENLLRELKNQFDKVVSRKPEASRARSSEVYLLAKGFRG